MPTLPSPCLDICKYKLRGGYCIACAMTKGQKRLYDGLRDEAAQRAFIEDLMTQQTRVKSARTWGMEYAGKCARHGMEPPFTLSDG